MSHSKKIFHSQDNILLSDKLAANGITKHYLLPGFIITHIMLLIA